MPKIDISKTDYMHKFTKEENSKGGKNVTEKKRFTIRLSALKRKKKLTEKDKKLLAMIENPKEFSWEILNFMMDWKDQVKTVGHATIVSNTLINLHKATHGEKMNNQNMNLNVNIDVIKFKELQDKYDKEENGKYR